MEKAIAKVGSFWVSRKAKQEISDLTDDLSNHPCARHRKPKSAAKTNRADEMTDVPLIASNCVEFGPSITHGLHSFTNTVEEKAKMLMKKLKGKAAKPLPDLLREYHLPPGLFPRNITCYEFDKSKGKLVVYMAASSCACEVCFKDSSFLRYSNRVKATLASGKLTAVEGMKTKQVMVWVKVSGVTVVDDKVCFVSAAGVKKSRSKDVYEVPRQSIQVEQF